MRRTFPAPHPVALHVNLGSGDLDVSAEDVGQTTVTVAGDGADRVTVEQRGNRILVLAAHRGVGFFAVSSHLQVHVSLPADSELVAELGSADVVAVGRLGTARVRSGSGAVRLGELAGDALVQSGSGDVHLGVTRGDIRARSASGDVHVREPQGDVTLSTASGDLYVGTMWRGELRAKNVSGDIGVGIPEGVPVWTDISCVTGSITSTLRGAGQPEEGQDFVRVRASTVSGDVHLEQVTT
jgi:hypothetical protein